MSALNVGAPCWLELAGEPTTEVLDFYERTLGWTYDLNPGVVGYRRAHAGGLKVAGFGGPPNPVPARGWRVYVGVADVDATLRLALRAGAVPLGPVVTVADGRFAWIADPTRAAVGLFESDTDPGTTTETGPGRVTGWTMQSPDHVASRRFHRRVFGVAGVDRVDFVAAGRADWVVHVAADVSRAHDLGDPDGNRLRLEPMTRRQVC